MWSGVFALRRWRKQKKKGILESYGQRCTFEARCTLLHRHRAFDHHRITRGCFACPNHPFCRIGPVPTMDLLVALPVARFLSIGNALRLSRLPLRRIESPPAGVLSASSSITTVFWNMLRIVVLRRRGRTMIGMRWLRH
jgi:hypothetical protein